ncbi:hypothetical protein PHLGIDRAFT_130182 [Phlebiopsis gigantea 11061_1 CR5-6]|uniref:Uncharacterized protein n=1 Tax=Phlebiopsis gigantea (strain 11061_1 CR5-6) TaxID=745531 RepID=A0A0C3S1V6_PHLG1|nr:hypothetical protein PHLGIDRAFT_130182 [Phlebiopsis gigantea 11061_1 CR5-6]
MSTTRNSNAKGKGKQPKKFVEHKDAALQLASIIADEQEGKAKNRIAKHHIQAQAPTRTAKARPSSKDKLKEVKAAIKAERTRIKKEKAKARKQETNQLPGATSNGDRRSHRDQPDPTMKKKKRVAFA